VAGARAIRIVGSRFSPEAMALRSFATRSHLAHVWIDLEEAPDSEVLLASMGLRPPDTPAVITPTAVLRRTSPAELAEHFRAHVPSCPRRPFRPRRDRNGPRRAGLSRLRCVRRSQHGVARRCSPSAVKPAPAHASRTMWASRTVSPGMSSYPGRRCKLSASGARLNVPCEATGLRPEHGFHVVTLSDGSELPCRTVIVAFRGALSPAHSRRSPTLRGGLACTTPRPDLEARICSGNDVIVVGGETPPDRPPSTSPNRAARSSSPSEETISRRPCPDI